MLRYFTPLSPVYSSYTGGVYVSSCMVISSISTQVSSRNSRHAQSASDSYGVLFPLGNTQSGCGLVDLISSNNLFNKPVLMILLNNFRACKYSRLNIGLL